ncbi:hypothetical protein TNCV_2739741, partial [Trichonephila clavipes]
MKSCSAEEVMCYSSVEALNPLICMIRKLGIRVPELKSYLHHLTLTLKLRNLSPIALMWLP